MILNINIPKNRAQKHIKLKLIEIQKGKESEGLILSIGDRTSKRESLRIHRLEQHF